MKKRRIAIFLVVMLIASVTFAADVTLDNTQVQTIDDSTYVPLRTLAEQLEATVGYSNGIAIIYKDGTVYAVDMANKTLVINNLKTGEKTSTDIDLENTNGSLYLPLETFASVFDVGSSYNSEDGSITVSTDKSNVDVYSSNLKASIDELDRLIAITTDEAEIAKLKEKRAMLYRTYLEYAGFVKFTGEYSTEEKKEVIKNIIEEIRKDTGSSVLTSKSTRAPSDQITGIGSLPKLRLVYGVRGVDKFSTGPAYGITSFYEVTGPYYGGSLEYELWANDKLYLKTYQNLNLWKEENTGKVYGLGRAIISNYFNDFQKVDVDVENLYSIMYKTNIFGDYNITFDENNEFILGDESFIPRALDAFSYYMNYTTTPSGFNLN